MSKERKEGEGNQGGRREKGEEREACEKREVYEEESEEVCVRRLEGRRKKGE